LRICWPALLVASITVLPSRRVEAQAQPSQWVEWNPWPAAATTPGPAAVAVPDSARVRRGYQHWRGAGLGAAIGGATGALAGAIAGGITSCDDCTQQPTAGTGALYGALIGGGAGGVLGFLVGLSSPKYVWVPVPERPRGHDRPQLIR